jgi:hypothetical protein
VPGLGKVVIEGRETRGGGGISQLWFRRKRKCGNVSEKTKSTQNDEDGRGKKKGE